MAQAIGSAWAERLYQESLPAHDVDVQIPKVALEYNYASKKDQASNFQIPLGQKWALVDLPMLDPFQTMEIIQIRAGFTGTYRGSHHFPIKIARKSWPPRLTPRMGYSGCPASEHEKPQQGPYPMSWHCQPTTEDMTRKKL